MAATKTFDEYTEIGRRQLDRFAEQPLNHFIDGVAVASVSGETFENHSPVDSMLLGHVAAGDGADVDAATGPVAPARSASGSCTASPTSSSSAPTTSQRSSASTPARRSAS